MPTRRAPRHTAEGELTPRPPFEFGKALRFLAGFTPLASDQTLATDSCDFIENYVQGQLPDSSVIGNLIINDCGALHTGNQQIHPSTSATCKDGGTVTPR